MSKKEIRIGFFCDDEWGFNTLRLILKKKIIKFSLFVQDI